MQVNKAAAAAPAPQAVAMAPSPGNLEQASVPTVAAAAVVRSSEAINGAYSPESSAVANATVQVPSVQAVSARAPSSILKFTLGRRLLGN